MDKNSRNTLLIKEIIYVSSVGENNGSNIGDNIISKSKNIDNNMLLFREMISISSIEENIVSNSTNNIALNRNTIRSVVNSRLTSTKLFSFSHHIGLFSSL